MDQFGSRWINLAYFDSVKLTLDHTQIVREHRAWCSDSQNTWQSITVWYRYYYLPITHFKFIWNMYTYSFKYLVHFYLLGYHCYLLDHFLSLNLYSALYLGMNWWLFKTTTWFWGQYSSLRTGQSKLEWHMARSETVNCILLENTCFIMLCYIIPNLWIKHPSYCLTTSTIIFLIKRS